MKHRRRPRYHERKASPLYREWWTESNQAGVACCMFSVVLLAAFILPHCL